MLTYKKIEFSDLSIIINIGSLISKNKVDEHHATIRLTENSSSASIQFDRLETAVKRLENEPLLKNASLVLKRFFVSDAINQAGFLVQSRNEAVSVVQQPPLNGTKASLWLYFISGTETSGKSEKEIEIRRPHHTHIYQTQLCENNRDVISQTDQVFENYIHDLKNIDCTLKDNCVRTWIYVQDVDVQYAGMVEARKRLFENEGLTADSHYIASTGIEGRYIHPQVLMLMDTYTVTNLQPGQMTYLYAPTHLNPTYEYGVTFERGTVVNYGDRRHVLISGTASINNKGEVVHPSNIVKQTERTFENIRILLEEAETGMKNIAKMIVYLRDTADYNVVSEYIERFYPEIPKVMVWAPVCRPGWLIEIECIALKADNNPKYHDF